jgi:hypothetical protein
LPIPDVLQFAFPFGQRPMVPGFAEGFFVPFSEVLLSEAKNFA